MLDRKFHGDDTKSTRLSFKIQLRVQLLLMRQKISTGWKSGSLRFLRNHRTPGRITCRSRSTKEAK